MLPLIGPYVAVAVGIVAIYIFLYTIRKRKHQEESKRQEELKKASYEIGFTYNPVADISLPDLNLFNTGYGKMKKNLLSAKKGNVKWSIFDYQFETGTGKNRRTHSQTVVMAQLDTELPEFSLEREYFLHKLGEVIGFKDIDFKDYPEFSKEYQLEGADEKAVRNLFTPHVISMIGSFQLEDHIEAKGNFIIMYKPHYLIRPADLYRIFHKANSIINLFR